MLKKIATIEADLSFEQAHKRYLISIRAQKYVNDPNFLM